MPKKANNKAVNEVILKQEHIRKNFEHSSSFNGNYSKAQNNSQSKERSRHVNEEKLSRNKSISKRGDQIERRNTFDPKKNKQLKPSQITRKEARARIGLGDIPDDKIETLIKQTKEKLKPADQNSHSQSVDEEPINPCLEYKSRQIVKMKIDKSNSSENSSLNKGNLRKEVQRPDISSQISFHPAMNIVNTKMPNSYFDEVKSSITDMEEFDHTYLQAYYNNATKQDSREEHRPKSKYSENQRRAVEPNEEVQYSHHNNNDNRTHNENRKELVKMQQKEMIRKLKEEKTKAKLEELKKKQNLDALNYKIKKKAEVYKKKKETEFSDKVIDILANDEAFRGANIKQNSGSVSISNEGSKLGFFGGQRQTSRTGTTKNSAGNSISQSIQSPLSRTAIQNAEEHRKGNTNSDENSSSSNTHIIKGRKTYNPKTKKI